MSEYHKMMDLIEEVKHKVSDNEYKCLIEQLSKLKTNDESVTKFYRIYYPKIDDVQYILALRENLARALENEIEDHEVELPSFKGMIRYESTIIPVEHDNDFRKELERMASNEHIRPVYSDTYGPLYKVERLN